MKIIAAGLVSSVLLAGALSACGPGVKGEYTCSGGMLEAMRLDSDGKAFLSATNLIGVKQSRTGEYKVEGDKVVITLDMQPHDFARNGKTLDGGPILGKCTAR